MVDFLGIVLNLVGNIFAITTYLLLSDSFFLRKSYSNRLQNILCFLFWFALSLAFSNLIGSACGYGCKVLCELFIYYGLCVSFYEGRWDRRFFVLVTEYAVLFSFSYWFDCFCLFCFKITYDAFVENIALYSICYLIKGGMVVSCGLLVHHFHKPLSVGSQARVWIPLSTIFPMATLIVLWIAYSPRIDRQAWIICLLILNVVDVVALLLLDHLEETSRNNEKLLVASERARIQDENIQALSLAYSSQRKMTHDFYEYISTLRLLLDSKRVDDANELLKELSEHQNQRILLVNCHHATVDAVLNQKGFLCKQKGIDVRFRVNDLSELCIPNVDLIVVLGNILDNAIEACQKCQKTDWWVSIQILLIKHDTPTLSILVVNPSLPVTIVNGEIETSKHDSLRHGYGLSNVKDVLNRYGAEYTFTYQNHLFIFSIDWPYKKD